MLKRNSGQNEHRQPEDEHGSGTHSDQKRDITQFLAYDTVLHKNMMNLCIP